MADINVQRKSPSAIWWILAIVALLILLWVLFGWDLDPAMTMIGPGASTAEFAAP
jgi:hypothetical protein